VAEEPKPRRAPLPLVTKEADLLPLALEVAARSGDPDPELVQHTTGSQEALTKLTGSWVYGDEPSWMVAIRGSFSGRRVFPPGPDWDHQRDEIESWPVLVLVVEIKGGRITDSGRGPEYPDLGSVGPVVTDYLRSS